jgi:hypothetical protein
VLEPANAADEVTVTSGTLEEPVVSESIQVGLFVSDTSGTYKLSTTSIELESIPTDTTGTPGSESDSSSNSVLEFLSDLFLKLFT